MPSKKSESLKWIQILGAPCIFLYSSKCITIDVCKYTMFKMFHFWGIYAECHSPAYCLYSFPQHDSETSESKWPFLMSSYVDAKAIMYFSGTGDLMGSIVICVLPQVQILNKKVDVSKVTSKCGSKDNIKHKPGLSLNSFAFSPFKPWLDLVLTAIPVFPLQVVETWRSNPTRSMSRPSLRSDPSTTWGQAMKWLMDIRSNLNTICSVVFS